MSLNRTAPELISWSEFLRRAGLPWSQRTFEILILSGIEPKGVHGKTKLYAVEDVARFQNWAAAQSVVASTTDELGAINANAHGVSKAANSCTTLPIIDPVAALAHERAYADDMRKALLKQDGRVEALRLAVEAAKNTPKESN